MIKLGKTELKQVNIISFVTKTEKESYIPLLFILSSAYDMVNKWS